MSEEFSLTEWTAQLDKKNEIQGKWAVRAAAATGLSSTIVVTSLFAALPGAPPGLAIVPGALAGSGAALLMFLMVALGLEYPLGRHIVTNPLTDNQRKLLRSIQRDSDAILKLNPPAKVIEEVMVLRETVDEVAANLIQLTRLLPKEELNKSVPSKWLEAASAEFSQVRQNLEEARLQAYSAPIALPSLEVSKQAISDERRFVDEVLSRRKEAELA